MARILIVGSGIAGLTTALHASQLHAHDVTVVTKGALAENNTRYAQGGIAAATALDDSAITGHAPLSGYLTVWTVCAVTALVAAVSLLVVPKQAFADHA